MTALSWTVYKAHLCSLDREVVVFEHDKVKSKASLWFHAKSVVEQGLERGQTSANSELTRIPVSIHSLFFSHPSYLSAPRFCLNTSQLLHTPMSMQTRKLAMIVVMY